MKITISPRYSEVDVLGHVTNSAIPAWFEQGRLPIFRLFSSKKNFSDISLILKKYDILFNKEIKMGEDVIIKTTIEKIGTTSITVSHKAHQNGVVVVQGNCTMVHFDYQNKKTVEIPNDIREKILSLQPEIWR